METLKESKILLKFEKKEEIFIHRGKLKINFFIVIQRKLHYIT